MTTDKTRVLIFDTTLRDGEQSPGATMTHEEKLEIAAMLDEMGVDIIEAGFPIASEGDFQAVSEIARQSRNAVICGLARANFKDIDRCWEAVRHAKAPADPHVYRHLAPAPRDPEPRPGPDGREDPRDGDPCAKPLRQRAVVAHGCDADRVGLPDPRGRDRDQGGRHDDQYPRHGGLHRARRERRSDPEADRGGAGRRWRHLRHALPQRSRHGDGELAGRCRRRRAPDRVHDQRPGRTRGQHSA